MPDTAPPVGVVLHGPAGVRPRMPGRAPTARAGTCRGGARGTWTIVKGHVVRRTGPGPGRPVPSVRLVPPGTPAVDAIGTDRRAVVVELDDGGLRSLVASAGLDTDRVLEGVVALGDIDDALLHESIDEWHALKRGGEAVAPASLEVSGLQRLVIGRLIRLALACEGGARQPPDRSRPAAAPLAAALVERITEYVDANLDGKVRVESLAGLARMSRGRFSRAFGAATGRTPYRYVLERRLARACALLEEGRYALVDIAGSCGFASQSHMTDVFRHHVGQTPGQFRRSLC